MFDCMCYRVSWMHEMSRVVMTVERRWSWLVIVLVLVGKSECAFNVVNKSLRGLYGEGSVFSFS